MGWRGMSLGAQQNKHQMTHTWVEDRRAHALSHGRANRVSQPGPYPFPRLPVSVAVVEACAGSYGLLTKACLDADAVQAPTYVC